MLAGLSGSLKLQKWNQWPLHSFILLASKASTMWATMPAIIKDRASWILYRIAPVFLFSCRYSKYLKFSFTSWTHRWMGISAEGTLPFIPVQRMLYSNGANLNKCCLACSLYLAVALSFLALIFLQTVYFVFLFSCLPIPIMMISKTQYI